jgi:hypothetical protein
MTTYRLYFIDGYNHIRDVRTLTVGSDAEAVEAAGRIARQRNFELWDRDRLVSRSAMA